MADSDKAEKGSDRLSNGLDMADFQRTIGHTFENLELLESALTHKSCEVPAPGREGNNERLETLGDAVLELAVSRHLFLLEDRLDEGMITRIRSFAVNREALAEAARRIGLDGFLKLGQTEIETGGSRKSRLLADAFEAVVGALFLDGGLEKASAFSLKLLQPRIEAALTAGNGFPGDHKTRLQEYAQKNCRNLPEYTVLGTEGPDHSKIFIVSVTLGSKRASGRGGSKQAAEKAAAGILLAMLRDCGTDRNDGCHNSPGNENGGRVG